VDDLYKLNGKINPTTGSLWCECAISDRGEANYNLAIKDWYDAYKAYT
jgi:hypothetical protein